MQIFNMIWERWGEKERQVNQRVSRLMVHAGCICKEAFGDTQDGLAILVPVKGEQIRSDF